MSDERIREPAQIRADGARKLKPVETGIMFTAALSGNSFTLLRLARVVKTATLSNNHPLAANSSQELLFLADQSE
jgi:hypothetical protein